MAAGFLLQSHQINYKQPQLIDTSDWLTYRNNEFGFEIKYPKTEAAQRVVKEQPEFELGTIIKFQADYAEDKDVFFGDIIYIVVDDPRYGTSSELPNGNEDLNGVEYATRSPYNNEVVSFSFSPQLQDYYPYPSRENLMGVIFSTFKFIKPIDTSDWKSYHSEKLGLEFKYPPNLFIDDNGEYILIRTSKKVEPEDPSLLIHSDPNLQDLTPEEYYDGNPGPSMFDRQESKPDVITIDGKTAYRFEPSKTLSCSVAVIVPRQTDFLNFFDNECIFQNDGTFDAILGSVELL